MTTIIGKFRKQDGGLFTGQIITLSFTANAMIEPRNEKRSEKSPDYRFLFIHENSLTREAGAAWRKKSKQGNTYLSLDFDDPALPAAMRCVLVKSAGEANSYDLMWERQRARRDGKAPAPATVEF